MPPNSGSLPIRIFLFGDYVFRPSFYSPTVGNSSLTGAFVDFANISALPSYKHKDLILGNLN